MQERYWTMTRTSWLASPSVRAQAQHVAQRVSTPGSSLRRGFPRRFMSHGEAQTSWECLRPQTSPAFAPGALVMPRLALACPRRVRSDSRRGFAQGGLIVCQSDGGAALLQSVAMCPFRTHALQQTARHSMSWSARRRKDSEIVSPRVLAVFKLMTSANLVGCWTGRWEGFAPFKILST